MCMHVYVRMYTHMYVCMRVYVCIYVTYVYRNRILHTYVYIYVHNIYIHVPRRGCVTRKSVQVRLVGDDEPSG